MPTRGDVEFNTYRGGALFFHSFLQTEFKYKILTLEWNGQILIYELSVML